MQNIRIRHGKLSQIYRHESPAFRVVPKVGRLMLAVYENSLCIDGDVTDQWLPSYSRIVTPARSKLKSDNSHSSVGISLAGLTSVPSDGTGVPSRSNPVPLLMNA